MSILYGVLSVLYILVCVSLITIILLQKKRTSGIGSISGMSTNSDTYWDKNKGRSIEGTLEKYTKIGGFVFFIFTVVMCIIR